MSRGCAVVAAARGGLFCPRRRSSAAGWFLALRRGQSFAREKERELHEKGTATKADDKRTKERLLLLPSQALVFFCYLRETEVRACARRSRFRLGFLVCLCDDGCFFDYDYIATDSSGLPAVIGARSNRSSLLETPTAVLEAERAYRVWIGALRRCLGEPPADTSCRTSRFERRAAVMVCSTLDIFFFRICMVARCDSCPRTFGVSLSSEASPLTFHFESCKQQLAASAASKAALSLVAKARGMNRVARNIGTFRMAHIDT